MVKEIVLHSGETREWVLVNEPETDWHVVQEEGSTLRLHVVCLPEKAAADAQWQSRIVVEQNGKGCKTELLGMGIVREQQQMQVHTRVLHNTGGDIRHSCSSMCLTMRRVGCSKAS